MTEQPITINLASLVDMLDRFSEDKNLISTMVVVGNLVYARQENDQFAINLPMKVVEGNTSASLTFRLDIKYLARWVAKAMSHSASNYSPLSMKVDIVTDYRNSVKLVLRNYDVPDHLAYSMNEITKAPSILDGLTHTAPSVHTDIPMHKILPYVRYNRAISRNLDLSISGIVQYPEWMSFSIDGLFGVYKK